MLLYWFLLEAHHMANVYFNFSCCHEHGNISFVTLLFASLSPSTTATVTQLQEAETRQDVAKGKHCQSSFFNCLQKNVIEMRGNILLEDDLNMSLECGKVVFKHIQININVYCVFVCCIGLSSCVK